MTDNASPFLRRLVGILDEHPAALQQARRERELGFPGLITKLDEAIRDEAERAPISRAATKDQRQALYARFVKLRDAVGAYNAFMEVVHPLCDKPREVAQAFIDALNNSERFNDAGGTDLAGGGAEQ